MDSFNIRKAVIPERFPLSTIEDLSNLLAGATEIFKLSQSKLEANRISPVGG